MSKQAFHGKVTLNSATDLGSGSWEVNVAFSDNLGVNNANGVQVGDVFIFNTGLSEQGTFTRFIVSAIGSINPFTGQATFTVDYDTTQDNVNVANLAQVVGNDGLATRPSSVYGLYPTPSTDFQVMNDAFAEYVSNMNIKKIDAITGGGSVDLSAYSTTQEMDAAIAAAIAAIPAPDLTGYASENYVDTAISTAVANVDPAAVQISDTAPANPAEGDLWWNSTDGTMYVYYNDGTTSQWVISNPLGDTVDLTGYATEQYVDTAVQNVSVDLTGYATETFVTDSIPKTIQLVDTRGEIVSTNTLDTYIVAKQDGNWDGTKPTGASNALGLISLHTHLGNYASQIALDTSGGALYTRHADNSTTYGAWNEHPTMAKVDAAITTAISGVNVTETVTAVAYDVATTTLSYTDENGTITDIDLSGLLDEDARAIANATFDNATGVITFTRDNGSTFTLDMSSLQATVSYNDLTDVPTNLAKVDTYNSFTGINDFQSDIRLFGNYAGTVDAEGNSISSDDFIKWIKRTKDADTNLLTGGETLQAWMGVPNWNNGFFINGPDGNGGTQYGIRLTDTGDIWLHSGLDNANPELIIEQGQVRSKGNFVAGGIFSGDGSGLTNLPQSDGFTYGTLKGLTTDDPTGNTYLGHEAGVYGSATQSVFLGLDAGRGKGAGSTANVAIGYGSLVDGGTQSRQVAIGHMALRNAGFTGGAGSVTLMGQTEADYLAAQAGNLNGVTMVAGGTGYTDGTYAVIATQQTNAGWNNVTAGSGLTLDVVTDGAGVITGVTINNAGSGYRTNEAVIIDGGDGNAAVIISSLVNTVSSTTNVAIGFQAGVNAKTARNSVLVGNESGAYNWTGDNNVFVGAAAGREAYNINNSVAIGENSGSGAGGNANTFVGSYAGQTVRGDNNIMLGAHAGKGYIDAVNSIVIGTQGNIPAGSREGVIEIGNSNNTRLYVPGVGLDTKLFHDLDNTTDQFMYYDASQQLFRPMEISINGIEVSNAANTVTNLTSVKLMGGSTTTVQHDLLAFGGKMGFDAFTAEGLRIDDDTWESTTLNNEIFTGKKDQSIYVTENDTTYTHTLANGVLDNNPGGRSVVHKAWRLTVDSQGQLGYCNSKDIQIGVGYIPGGSMARVTIEYATTSDLANWVTASESDAYFGAAYLNFSTLTFSNHHGVRITIAPYQRFSNTNGYGTFHPDSEGTWPSINLSAIKMMTSRPGSQGSGPERSFPYDWNSNKEVIFDNSIYLPNNRGTEDALKPVLAFTGDADTGIGKTSYYDDGSFGVITNGVERIVFTSDPQNPIQVADAGGTLRKVFFSGTGGHGPGSNLNADLLDSLQGSEYVSKSAFKQEPSGAYIQRDHEHIGDMPYFTATLEQNGIYSPFWGSVLGTIGSRVGLYDATTNPDGIQFTGVGTVPTTSTYNVWTNGNSEYAAVNSTNFPTPADRAVIEIPIPDGGLQYGGAKVGITFGSNSTKADFLLMEVRNTVDGTWEDASHWYENGQPVYGALDGTQGKPIDVQHTFIVPNNNANKDRIRITIGMNTVKSCRIVHVFGVKYNAKMGDNLYLPRSGGEVYGDVTVRDSATIGETLTLGVLTAPPAAPVNGMIAIADGTTWDPTGTGTQSCVVYLAGNWVAMASA